MYTKLMTLHVMLYKYALMDKQHQEQIVIIQEKKTEQKVGQQTRDRQSDAVFDEENVEYSHDV